MLEHNVYKFLDWYVGGGINISSGDLMYDPYTMSPVKVYFISSDNGTSIIRISNKGGIPSIVFEEKLGGVVSNFFYISKISSHSYISSWFKGKHNIKELWDLKEFIGKFDITPF